MKSKYFPVVFIAIILSAGTLSAYTETTEFVPMRDSIELATTIYLPDSFPPPYPVILERTPYGRHIDPTVALAATDFLGYAYVCQNLRGRHDSEGTPRLFLSDAWGELRDGYDCIDWIVERDWCDGNVGMFGASAPGMTQYMAAGAAHPNLKCCVPVMAGPSMYHHSAYNGGAFRKVLVETWLEGIDNPFLIDTVANHPVYDSMWAVVNLAEVYDSVTVPMYHVTGWYDMYTDGQIEAFQELQERLGNQKLMICPWGHGDAAGSVEQGDLIYPSNAEMNIDLLILLAADWYNYWLKGMPTGVMDEPAVRYYLTGDCSTSDTSEWNHWVDQEEWPPPGMAYDTLFLSEGCLLGETAPTTSHADTYLYDPENPCPTIGGREYIGLSTGYGPKDQRPIESRSDVLVFSTDVLEEPLHVAGKLRFVLFGASDRIDTDFAVRVTDVYPDSSSILMTDNILRARHRHSLSSEDFLTPGEPDTFDIDLWSIGHVFNAGHRIRVIISSSNYPRFSKNPNTGAPFQRDDSVTVVAENVVYRSPEMPSHLLLPVVSSGTLCEDENNWTPGNSGLAAFPNPFNATCEISLPDGTSQLEIFDISGRRVHSAAKISGGKYRWTPGEAVPGGIYLLRAFGDSETTAKIIYMK